MLPLFSKTENASEQIQRHQNCYKTRRKQEIFLLPFPNNPRQATSSAVLCLRHTSFVADRRGIRSYMLSRSVSMKRPILHISPSEFWI
ncbi:hypothetical protein CEXT_348261 [Caerostris extrusa]|uniref:Ycf15 n=1 Tax=Caerostris extrusa TaxID=172846 RepID=A0AAV4URJ4_CAEEX|nr:hypothetical protein CEXT_348261 [Caerostris extrusa]